MVDIERTELRAKSRQDTKLPNFESQLLPLMDMNYRTALSLTNNQAKAEDVTQET